MSTNNNNNGIKHEVGHFEIPADNVDGLKSFYSSLFGWQFEKGETQGYYMTKAWSCALRTCCFLLMI
jgi:predicted enzyme related to lactoylglutathione lyase